MQRPKRLRGAMLLAMALVLGGCGGGEGEEERSNDNGRATGDGEVSEREAFLAAFVEGVGRMERFEYAAAEAAFARALRLEPSSVPTRINLGIALLNRNVNHEGRVAAEGVSAERFAIELTAPEGESDGYYNGVSLVFTSGSLEGTQRTVSDYDAATHTVEFDGQEGDDDAPFPRAPRPGDSFRLTTRDPAIALFEDVLEQDGRNPHAHFCLGIIYAYAGESEAARPHFEAVLEVDPEDAASWYWLGQTYGAEQPTEAVEALRRALELNSYYQAAYNALNVPYRLLGQDEEADGALDEFMRLRAAAAGDPTDFEYEWMGRYANVIRSPFGDQEGAVVGWEGPDVPRLEPVAIEVSLAPGARPARSDDFGDGAVDQVRRWARERFGVTMVALDYDGDGLQDLYVVGAVADAEGVRDALLRQVSEGRFQEVTAEVGLDDARTTLGVAAADFNNDLLPDLFLSCAGPNRLFRNRGNGGFEDVTSEAGVAGDDEGVHLAAAFLDFEHDGDLDLYVCRYGSLADASSLSNSGGEPPAGGVNDAFVNVGVAQFLADAQAEADAQPDVVVEYAHSSNQPWRGPLSVAFERLPEEHALCGPTHRSVGLAAADFDQDRDLDLVVIGDHEPAVFIENDRLMRFSAAPIEASAFAPGMYNGLAAADLNGDGRTDLVALAEGAPALVLENRATEAVGELVWRAHATEGDAWSLATAIDLDLDGRQDLVGLTAGNRPRVLFSDEALVADEELRPVGMTWADFTGDALHELALWSDESGLHIYRMATEARWIALSVAGFQERAPGGPEQKTMRTNADAIGTRITLNDRAGVRRAAIDYTGHFGGLGQAARPIIMGLGPGGSAALVRLDFPDGVLQAEMDLDAGELHRLVELQRRGVSCPLLFTFDGQRMQFVTDLLGVGGLGYMLRPGQYAQPRPWEAVKIEPHMLAEMEGRYLLSIAEPMDEVCYLDDVRLEVVDHPSEYRVYPDERFTVAEPPSGELIAFSREVFPVSAQDHNGRDATDALARWDRVTADGFRRRAWPGYAEPNAVVLDFGERLAEFDEGAPLVLCLAGWVEYPYSQTNYAASTAGLELELPVLERLDAQGNWQTLVADPGYPAGLSRMMTLDVTGLVTGERCVLRLRSAMEVYWDQAFIAVRDREAPLVVHELPPAEAVARHLGALAEVSPDGRLPMIYDYEQRAPILLTRPAGPLTPYGDVTELVSAADDRFAIFGAGGEVLVAFDASRVPELPDGWTRSFVLRARGYCKDADLMTASGDTIYPLPYAEMPQYPYEEGYR